MFYNFTTPDSFSQDDTIFVGLSSWNTYSYGDADAMYDQEGFVAGSWYVTQTSNPCASSNAWCAYFSLCLAGAVDSYCSSGTQYFTTWEWELQPSTPYEEELSISSTPSQTGFGYVDLYSGYLWNGAGQLLDSWTEIYSGAYEDFLTVEYQECFSSECYLGFTDYEEIYGDLNPVENWPAFNIHTSIGFVSFQHDSTADIPFGGGFGWEGTGWPTDDPGSFSDKWYSGLVHVNISNMPFAVWVGNAFGSGLYSVYITSTEGSHFSARASINPLEDPSNSGTSVEYQANYCSLPCGDYSYYPSSSSIQPDSDLYSPNANMWINGTVPAAGTYTISMYAWDGNPVDSTYLSYWTITFEY